MKYVLLIAFLFTCNILVFSQQNTKIRQTYFSSGINIYQGLQFKHEVPEEVLRSSPMPHFSFGVSHLESLKRKNCMFMIGYRIAKHIYSYRFTVNVDDFGYHRAFFINVFDNSNATIHQLTTTFYKKVFIRNKSLIQLGLGLDLYQTQALVSGGESYSFNDSTGKNNVAKLMEMKANYPTYNFFLGIHAKIDFKIIEKQKFHNCGYSFSINYSPQKIAKGRYAFGNTQYNGRGEVFATINHLSLEFYYYFTRKKNKTELSEFELGI
jgi:hypothetical protein